ncbi:hypothetical protein GCM10009759_00320 [Kitasatospora saccharophila]|uniref:Uncharacterized protein n=1 Tax=Kitasatospora saccharophila TaxID=407973 RepID=A0ABN2W5S0_9ACTN
MYTPPSQPEASSAETSAVGSRNTIAGTTYRNTHASPYTAIVGADRRLATELVVISASVTQVILGTATVFTRFAATAAVPSGTGTSAALIHRLLAAAPPTGARPSTLRPPPPPRIRKPVTTPTPLTGTAQRHPLTPPHPPALSTPCGEDPLNGRRGPPGHPDGPLGRSRPTAVSPVGERFQTGA